MKFFYDSKRKRFQKITSFIVVFVFLETNCGLSYGADALALKSNRERPKHLSQLAADVGVPVSAMDGILGDLKGASISQGTLNSDDSKAYLNVILNGRTVSVPALKNILGEVNGETVLVRVDYNVKIAENGSIKDDKRITATLPTLKALRDAGAKIVLMSHLQPDDKGVREIDTLKPVAARLGELLGEKVEFSGQPFESQWDWSGLKEDISGLKDGEILLIENLRFNKGEKKNDPDFSRRLVEAIGAKFFVQDAFGTVHRKHASMVGVPELIENKAAGLLVEREAKYLGDMILNAERPLAVIQGGSKVSTKIEIINNLLNNIMKEGDILILGGALAYTFMKADNPDVKIGSSLIEEGMIGDAATALKTARDKGITVLLPIDHTITRNINDTKFAMLTHNPDIPDGFMGVDIGRETVNLMLAYLNNAKTVLWNGPVGAFDINDQFGNGTEAIAKHLAYLTYEEEVTTIGVGGDTALAAKKYKVSDQITYISTAGGAAMDFLAGNAPGIEILEQKLSSDLDLAKKIEGDFEEIGEISLSYSEQDVRRAMKNRGEKLLAISENLRKLKVPALNGHIKTLADGFLVMANRFSNNGTIKDVIIAIAAAFNEADEFKRLKKEALDVVSTVKWNRLSSDSDQREYRDKIYNGFRGIGAFEISHAEDNSGRAKDRMRDMRNKLSDISAYLSLLELPDKGKKEAKRISDGIRGLNERIGALTYNGDVAAIKAGIAAEAKEYGALIYETKRLAIESILYGLRGGGISVAKDAVDALVRFGMNRNQAEASVKEIASSDLKKNVWRERQLENAFVNDNYDKERGGRRLYSDAKTDYGVDRILASDDGKFARQLALELNGKIGNRGRFEGLFKDGDNERGGWVKRPWEVLASNLPEEVEETAERLREEGVETLGFVAMGGEGSIIGASTKGVINISSTSPRKLKRYLDGRDLAKMRWYIVSKSGGTTETTENGNFLERRYSKAGFDPRKYITYVTDPGNRLEDAKNKDGFTVEYREFNKQTTIGGRNTLVNNPTLLAYAWRNPGKLRAMIEALTKAHTFEGGASDPWIKAAAMATPLFRDGRYKVGIIQPEWIREMQWPWEEQNPEESLGKKNGGFTVYTNRPDIDTLERMKDNGWMFVEFQVKGEEDETGDYAEAARRAGYAVVTIPVLESNKDFAAQAVSYGWMKFVATVGGIWDEEGINFSNQPAVESYKKHMKDPNLTLQTAIDFAGKNIVLDNSGIIFVYDGLMPHLNEEQRAVIEGLRSKDASAADIYAKLIEFTWPKLDAQTIAYYDDAGNDEAAWLDKLTQEILHKGMGLTAKWGEGTGVLHGLFVNWYSGRPHQIPVHIVAAEHEQPALEYREGGEILKKGAAAAHLALAEAKRPSVMLIVQGRLDESGRATVQNFFEDVKKDLKLDELAADKVDLQKYSGLPLTLSEDGTKLLFKDKPLPKIKPGTSDDMPDIRVLEDIASVLQNSDIVTDGNAGKILYYTYRDIYFKDGGVYFRGSGKTLRDSHLRYDITIIPPAMLSREFVKTNGHYHPLVPGQNISYPEVYEVISGRALYLLQKTREVQDGTPSPDVVVEDVIAVEAGPGEKVIMPPDYAHITINLQDEPLVMANWVSDELTPDYGPIETHGGGAYFVTRDKEGKPRFEFNTRYPLAPPIRLLSAAETIDEFGLVRGRPMYDLINSNPDKLDFLKKPQGFKDIFKEVLFPSSKLAADSKGFKEKAVAGMVVAAAMANLAVPVVAQETVGANLEPDSAIEMLYRKNMDKKEVEEKLSLLKDIAKEESKEVRSAIVKKLMGTAFDISDKATHIEKAQAIRALADIDAKESIPGLIGVALNEKIWAVKEPAIEALGKIGRGSKDATEALKKISQNEDEGPYIRSRADFAIKETEGVTLKSDSLAENDEWYIGMLAEQYSKSYRSPKIRGVGLDLISDLGEFSKYLEEGLRALTKRAGSIKQLKIKIINSGEYPTGETKRQLDDILTKEWPGGATVDFVQQGITDYIIEFDEELANVGFDNSDFRFIVKAENAERFKTGFDLISVNGGLFTKDLVRLLIPVNPTPYLNQLKDNLLISKSKDRDNVTIITPTMYYQDTLEERLLSDSAAGGSI